MAGNGWNGWKWMKIDRIARNCWKSMEVVGDGWKIMEIAEVCWKWLKMD